MIEVGYGDLLAADVAALVNAVNMAGVMGKGIALQFKRVFPENYRAYRDACARGEVQIGRMFMFDRGNVDDRGKPTSRRHIINFPTKRHWRNPSRLEEIQAGLGAFVEVIERYSIGSVAVPALRCGNGGLEWAAVRPLIEQACTPNT